MRENVPILTMTEVLVVGSGPAGICAAVAARRHGADTLLIERYGCLGGALTMVNVQSYGFSINKNHAVLSGLPLELEERAIRGGATQPDYRGEGQFISSEIFKCLLDEWMETEGIRVLLHCPVCGTFKEGNLVKGVYVATKQGIALILAKRTVDATGDGDVCFFAGADFAQREKSRLQPVTVVYGIGGVDLALFRSYHKEHVARNCFGAILKTAAEKGEWNYRKRGGAYKTVREDGSVESLNLTTCYEIDATDVFDLTHAEMECRKMAVKEVELFCKYGAMAGLQNCYLRNLSVQLGIRETRRIIGDAILSQEDFFTEQNEANSIGRCILFVDDYGKMIMDATRTFAVPSGAILPRKLENIAVAGRCISAAEDAFGAIRLMPCCAMTGEAAGTASALSVRSAVMTRELPLSQLQTALNQAGVKL